VLTLAALYGWTPAGTQAPDDDSALGMHGTPDWDGSYFPGVGQHVTDADALALAEALERALPDLPDREAFQRLTQPPADPTRAVEYMPTPKLERATSAFELYSGAWKEALRDFIAYLAEEEEGGGFDIWSYGPITSR
jgi:hypothetical protein